MTVHNLDGVLELEKLGFSRCVLSRELPISEIEYICKNSNIEIETFVHGALCVCYSGQCLFSSIIGGRSGNRGKCAQPCRLPYTLLSDNTKLDFGYLLSPKDLCGLDYLPKLISAGVTSLKIEGRMKSPVYVATVTRIYRKYIDLAYSSSDFNISKEDKTDLLQVFNRGGSSLGHLSNSANTDLVYKNKPNNMGLYLGKIQKYSPGKGLITLKCATPISVHDSISIESENGLYTISEMTKNGQNIKESHPGDLITIGRMKGNIKINNKVFKMSSNVLTKKAEESYSKENKKIHLTCEISVHLNEPIKLSLKPLVQDDSIYKNIHINITSDIIPQVAVNSPITKDRIKLQINKTGNTQFCFDNITINMDDNIFIPKMSDLNKLRRDALEQLEIEAMKKILRDLPNNITSFSHNVLSSSTTTQISVYLNYISADLDYTNLTSDIKNVYIPLKYFSNTYFDIINYLCNKFNVYITMPNILRMHAINNLNIDDILKRYHIKGFIISNIADVHTLNKYNGNYEFIANTNLNIHNTHSICEYEKLGISKVILNPELNKDIVNLIVTKSSLPIEVIVYGKIALMTMNYCPLGKSNKCYKECDKLCMKNKKYYLQDRKDLKFRLIPDNTRTITTIYNSKTISITPSEYIAKNYRIDILDENIDEINTIIHKVLNNEKINGNEYTNGNLNKEI